MWPRGNTLHKRGQSYASICNWPSSDAGPILGRRIWGEDPTLASETRRSVLGTSREDGNAWGCHTSPQRDRRARVPLHGARPCVVPWSGLHSPHQAAAKRLRGWACLGRGSAVNLKKRNTVWRRGDKLWNFRSRQQPSLRVCAQWFSLDRIRGRCNLLTSHP